MSKKKPDPIPLTITIPGGKATFWSRDELPPRRERELEVLYAQLDPRKLRRLRDAQRVILEDGEIADDSPILDGPDATLTEQEARLLSSGTDVAAWAYLKSWTLHTTRMEGDVQVATPRPLPETADAVLDLPKPLYKAITEHAAKLVARDIDDQKKFTVQGVEDPESPTGA